VSKIAVALCGLGRDVCFHVHIATTIRELRIYQRHLAKSYVRVLPEMLPAITRDFLSFSFSIALDGAKAYFLAYVFFNADHED